MEDHGREIGFGVPTVAEVPGVKTANPPGCVGKPNDPVNHPTHYTSHPSGVECIEIAEHMTFNVGNCIKYLWRAGLKKLVTDQELEDLRKARWYLDREIAQHETRRAATSRFPSPPRALGAVD